MVTLPSKTLIQSFNIDTVEKALTFGALALRAALVGADNANAANSNVSLTPQTLSNNNANLNIEFFIRYNTYQFNTKGGELSDTIIDYDSNSPNLDTELTLASQPTASGLVIPDYDEAVINSLEKYIVYYAQILWASVENKGDGTVSFTFLSQQDEPQIWIQVKLPLNLNQWLAGDNYLDAISTVVTEYAGSEPPGLNPSDFTQLANYSVSYEYPDTYTEMELWEFHTPGILETIYIETYYEDTEGIFDCYFYLNGQEIPYEDFSDYGDGTIEITFDTVNNPIIFEVGEKLDIEIYEDEVLSQVDAYLYILETPTAQP